VFVQHLFKTPAEYKLPTGERDIHAKDENGKKKTNDL
jgi:hypothetical protein